METTSLTQPQSPGWPTKEDTERALDIARRLAPYRRACSYETEDLDD
jgi:hypothetical protein